MSARAAELEPANDEAHYLLATILTWESAYRSALGELNRMSAAARAQVGAVALNCADEAGVGDAKLTTEAELALSMHPALSEQDAWTCIPQLRAAKRAELIDELLTATSAHSALSPRGLRILGLAQEAEKKLSAARATLEKAFGAGADPVSTLADLTRVAKAAGDNQGALGYLAHARDLEPKDARLPYEFGVICLRMGLFAEARKAIGTALELEPESADYNLGMGLVVSYSEDPSQALAYLEKYHALQPRAADGLLALGSALFRAKEFDKAAGWLKQAAARPETAPEAHYYLARIARQEGRLDEAKSELNECLHSEPNQANALAELGQIEVTERNYQKAAETLQRAIALDADNYAANFGLLQLYARTGDTRREAQSKRFDEIKDKKEERDLQMMRSIEIRRDGEQTDQR
jgi:tetratricopeptide (TPR) repeat protein